MPDQKSAAAAIKIPDHAQFRRDMEQLGLRVIDYRGRYHWSGPAVVVEVSQLHDVIRATKIRLQTDSMGLDIVVYPVKSATNTGREVPADA